MSLQWERRDALPGHVVLSHPRPSLDFTLRTEEAVMAIEWGREARRQSRGSPATGGWHLISVLGVGVQKEHEKG